MNKKIKIELNPLLSNSNNLIENFFIIGYDEKTLLKFPSIQNIQMSVISSIIPSDKFFDEKIIIKQMYPLPPNIIQVDKTTIKPNPTSVVFYSCFDSLDGCKK